jgi:hypothetical protein
MKSLGVAKNIKRILVFINLKKIHLQPKLFWLNNLQPDDHHFGYQKIKVATSQNWGSNNH